MLKPNALDYAAVLKAAYQNAGLAVPTNIFGDPNNPSVPQYIFAAPGTATATDAFGRPTAVEASKYAFPNTLIMPGSAGTDWWGSVFGHGQVQDYNLDVNGGS